MQICNLFIFRQQCKVMFSLCGVTTQNMYFKVLNGLSIAWSRVSRQIQSQTFQMLIFTSYQQTLNKEHYSITISR